MTTNLNINPRDSSGSYSLLHGVHGGNGKRGLNSDGLLHAFLHQRNTEMGTRSFFFFCFCLFYSQRWRSQGVYSRQGSFRETGKTVVNLGQGRHYYGILGKGVEQHEVLSSAFVFCFFRLSFTYIQMREVLRLGGFGNGGLSRGLTLKYSNWFFSPLSKYYFHFIGACVLLSDGMDSR
jgi:hypothetical protein